jgi:hypothetical protein
MGRVRWIKLQDFWLRLGLLKALVAVLTPDRQSIGRDDVIRRLTKRMFGPAPILGDLRRQAEAQYGAPLGNDCTLATMLLFASGSRSWGQPIHGMGKRTNGRVQESNLSKVLEWGVAAGLVGTGWRLTERGMLLRHLFDRRQLADFLAGSADAWNPFALSSVERAFFLYHLGECDEALWRMAFTIGQIDDPSLVLDAGQARFITAEALSAVLAPLDARSVPPAELSTYKAARQSLQSIKAELGDPNIRTISSPRRASLRQGAKQRQSRKHADHEAIPRMEQLIDLGFLTKDCDSSRVGQDRDKDMKRWAFRPAAAAKEFFRVSEISATTSMSLWQQCHFARCVVQSGLCEPRHSALECSDVCAARLFEESYREYHRSVGHTPFESVAILTMLRGIERGQSIEVSRLHSLMLAVKTKGGLGGKAFFAAGNTVDRMFIVLRDGFADAYDKEFASRSSS